MDQSFSVLSRTALGFDDRFDVVSVYVRCKSCTAARVYGVTGERFLADMDFDEGSHGLVSPWPVWEVETGSVFVLSNSAHQYENLVEESPSLGLGKSKCSKFRMNSKF